jgi:putative transposase
MMDVLGNQYSVRRRCSVLGIRRQTYHKRKGGHRPECEDDVLRQLLHRVAKTFLAWGFWMIFHYLRNQGFDWNHKRVYRVWKEEGLNLRKAPKRPKIRRAFLDLIAPDEINQGWAMDFLSEWVVGLEEQSVRVINIVDECSRRDLWVEAHYSITGKKLTDILDKLVSWRGKPAYIRCDNGPEFICDHLLKWAKDAGIEIRHIQAGKPTQNGIIERLNGTLRTECLNLEWFRSLEYLNQKLQEWWFIYNEQRPHSSIKYLTPVQFEDKNKLLYYSLVAA